MLKLIKFDFAQDATERKANKMDVMSGESVPVGECSSYDARTRDAVKSIYAKANSKRAALRKQLKDAVEAVHYMERRAEADSEYNTVSGHFLFLYFPFFVKVGLFNLLAIYKCITS